MITLSWNVNRFYTRSNLKIILLKQKYDYLCIQETHFKPEQTRNPLKNYKIYRKDRQTNTYGGGVAIFVHKDNYSEELALNTNLEAVAVRV